MKGNLTLTLAILLAFSVLRPAPAMAAFGTFGSLGTTLTNSDVSCAFVATGVAACAGRGTANTFIVNRFNGTWSGFAALPGVITSNPSCADNGSGHVICAARDADDLTRGK